MSDSDPFPVEPQPRVLSEPAKRALAEAEARRVAVDAVEKNNPRPREVAGRKDGHEPTRYGDWESKGIISDF